MTYSSDAIPTMTSNSAPAGVASASSEYGTNSAYKAMDDDTGTTWLSSANPPQWLQYQFASAIIVTAYTIRAPGDAVGCPAACKLMGSKDGSTWSELDSRTGLTWSAGEVKTFEVSNRNAYSHYRVTISATYPSAGWCAIPELQFFTTTDPLSYVDVVPVMTAADAPSGLASASSDYLENYAWKAFDDVDSESTNRWLSDDNCPEWLRYQFDEATVIVAYSITAQAGSDGDGVPWTWTFQGSNNGSTWTTLDTRTLQSADWAASERREFAFSNATAYSYYQLAISACQGAGWVALAEMEMMEVAEAPAATPDLFLDGHWG